MTLIAVRSPENMTQPAVHCDTAIVDRAKSDLAAKSSHLGTAKPRTRPNRRDRSTGCTEGTRCRTTDLAQVRSATPTCRRTLPHQYGGKV
ncbi:hypothetical protein GW17_00014105 [Ensete ventricosum]|nr:hypothetical protein GW17_00014105 [Ensete ventricosum]